MDSRRIASTHSPFLTGAPYPAQPLPKRQSMLQGKDSFASILAQSKQSVTFSQHALQRLEERDILLSNEEIKKLDGAMDKMAEKGARTSLICMKDVAFVVSVANRTVITAMDGTSAKENIFTNIDSAAIL